MQLRLDLYSNFSWSHYILYCFIFTFFLNNLSFSHQNLHVNIWLDKVLAPGQQDGAVVGLVAICHCHHSHQCRAKAGGPFKDPWGPEYTCQRPPGCVLEEGVE